MLNEVDWVTILSALLTPTTALCTIALGFLQYRLAIKNREDKLFDLDFGQIPSIFRHKIRPNKRNLH